MPDARALRRATPPPSLPACPLPSSSGCPGDATQLPRPLSHSPSPSSSPLSPSLARTERCHRRRSPLPRPPPPPRPSVVSTRSATVGYASSTRRTAPDALERRHRHRLHLRPPQIAIAASSSPARPRPQRAACKSSVSPASSPLSSLVALALWLSFPPWPKLRRHRAHRRRSSGDHLVTSGSPTSS